MNSQIIKSAAFVSLGFAAGLIFSQVQEASAFSGEPTPQRDVASREFSVSVDEIKQNFVFAEKFTGSYSKSFELSDGSKREIRLTPMVHDGMEVIEFRDNGGRTYMSLNGATTNGTLMVQVQDVEAMRALGKEQGW